MSWEQKPNEDRSSNEVCWDTDIYEWRTIDGEEHLCPIKKEPIADSVWSGRKFRSQDGNVWLILKLWTGQKWVWSAFTIHGSSMVHQVESLYVELDIFLPYLVGTANFREWL